MVKLSEVRWRKIVIRNYTSPGESKQLELPPGVDISTELAQMPDAEVIEDLYVTADGKDVKE